MEDHYQPPPYHHHYIVLHREQGLCEVLSACYIEDVLWRTLEGEVRVLDVSEDPEHPEAGVRFSISAPVRQESLESLAPKELNGILSMCVPKWFADGQNFTNADVYRKAKILGCKCPRTTARDSVNRLVAEGVVRVVHRGSNKSGSHDVSVFRVGAVDVQ
jgi:hypothetical protein